ncbi:hypothetical protein ABEB36_003637 [Hypothenemus hampei]|uniref:Tyr recombinase domain-containing protein n=1 Tax=Hypothenemus hampei TaxID=57062 RepID=A0ABD1FBP1_HYPHA
MGSNSDEIEMLCTPPELREIAKTAVTKLLPSKSKSKYEKEYDKFSTWCESKNVTRITENIVLAYFEIMGQRKKASTLWSSYSMLRTCLSINKNVDISKYLKLQAYLKRKSENYEPKKSYVLECEHITPFISDADDITFLAMKVILIIGYCGALRRDELTKMALNDVDLKPDMVIVTVPKTKTNISRVFMITEETWITLIRKYIELRPSYTSHQRFFLTYRRGKCIPSPIGINKIGEVPKNIAKFLKLPNPEKYTGHCFRRSSASNLANKGGDLLTIKKFAGWKSSAVAESYVDASIKKRIEIAKMFSPDKPEVSISTITPNSVEDNIINVETIQDAAPAQNQNIISSKQSFPEIQISASETSTITVKIYSHCDIKH